jgi:hypothetical protein
MNVYDVITGVDANGDEFTLPSLAQQWKDDMNMRCATMIKRGLAVSDDFRWRAPQEFIDTGRWPKNTSRPVTTPVSNDIPF